MTASYPQNSPLVTGIKATMENGHVYMIGLLIHLQATLDIGRFRNRAGIADQLTWSKEKWSLKEREIEEDIRQLLHQNTIDVLSASRARSKSPVELPSPSVLTYPISLNVEATPFEFSTEMNGRVYPIWYSSTLSIGDVFHLENGRAVVTHNTVQYSPIEISQRMLQPLAFDMDSIRFSTPDQLLVLEASNADAIFTAVEPQPFDEDSFVVTATLSAHAENFVMEFCDATMGTTFQRPTRGEPGWETVFVYATKWQNPWT